MSNTKKQSQTMTTVIPENNYKWPAADQQITCLPHTEPFMHGVVSQYMWTCRQVTDHMTYPTDCDTSWHRPHAAIHEKNFGELPKYLMQPPYLFSPVCLE